VTPSFSWISAMKPSCNASRTVGSVPSAGLDYNLINHRPKVLEPVRCVRRGISPHRQHQAVQPIQGLSLEDRSDA
jgi:hypothetical protein